LEETSEGNRLFLEKKAKFARGTIGAQVVGEMEGGSGAGGYCGIGTKSTEGKQAGGFVETEARSKLAGGSTQDAAAESGIESPEAIELDGDGGLAGSGADSAAASADRFTGEEELREDSCEFSLPARFFFAG
jgi:hypothetical protein